MSNAAFAGFLRLLLTPLNEAPRPTSELRAYLDYLSSLHPPRCDPLSSLGGVRIRQLLRAIHARTTNIPS